MEAEGKVCHCGTRISWLVVRGGTINFQIVKQEGEYTPQVSDTVTHVLLRTHPPLVVPSLKFYRGTNPTKTIIKLCTLQPPSTRRSQARGAENPARNRTGIDVPRCSPPPSPKLETARIYILIILTSRPDGRQMAPHFTNVARST